MSCSLARVPGDQEVVVKAQPVDAVKFQIQSTPKAGADSTMPPGPLGQHNLGQRLGGVWIQLGKSGASGHHILIAKLGHSQGVGQEFGGVGVKLGHFPPGPQKPLRVERPLGCRSGLGLIRIAFGLATDDFLGHAERLYAHQDVLGREVFAPGVGDLTACHCRQAKVGGQLKQQPVGRGFPGQTASFNLDEEMFSTIKLDQTLGGGLGLAQLFLSEQSVDRPPIAPGKAQQSFPVTGQPLPRAKGIEPWLLQVAGGNQVGKVAVASRVAGGKHQFAPFRHLDGGADDRLDPVGPA